MVFLKGFGLFVLSILASFVTGQWFVEAYQSVFASSGGFFGFDLGGILMGLMIAYIFSLLLIFTAWSGQQKYWWMGILLIPAVWFVIQFDLSHWWFYVAVGLIGWLIGFGINKFWFKLRRQN